MPCEPSRRAWVVGLLLAGAVGVLAAAPGAFVRSTAGGQAAVDEPHYLLTAISLAEDRDLDVDDELDEARWRAFHDATLPQQAAPRPDGSRISPHDPLLPAVLAAPYALGGLTGARWLLAVVNGLLAAALVHLAVRRFGVPLRTSVAVAAVAAASVPFVVYGSQVYPELPAALAVAVAVDAGLATPSRRATAAVVLAVVALPWLAVKYVPVAATVAALHLWRLHREHDARAHLVATLGAYAVAGVTYVVGHLAWYGGLTVYATGDFFREHGGQLSVLGTDPAPLGRTRRLAGLLVDRGFGIAAWQPAWLALAPALGAVVRRRPPAWAWLVLPLAAGWLTATYVAVTMHGYWFPGRQVVHALPLAVVLLAWWVARLPRPALAAVAALGALGLWSTAALLLGGLSGDVTWVVDFTEVDHPGYRRWRLLLPDHLHRPPGTAWWTAAWVAGLLGAVAAGARWPGRDGTGRDGVSPGARRPPRR